MATFSYDILVGKGIPASPGVTWFLASNMNQNLGPDLPLILNQLGQRGWEVVAVGNIGFDPGNEILLKLQH